MNTYLPHKKDSLHNIFFYIMKYKQNNKRKIKRNPQQKKLINDKK